MTYLSTLPFMTVFRPVRRLGPITGYMTIEEVSSDELVITEHPVQNGSNITDHSYMKQPALSVRIQFSEGDSPSTLDETYRRMLELQESRVPFEVVTGRRIYKNMLIKSLRHVTDKNTNSVLSISADLTGIKLTQATTVLLPPRTNQKQPGRTGATEKAGQKNAEQVTNSESKRRSALKSAAGIFND